MGPEDYAGIAVFVVLGALFLALPLIAFKWGRSLRRRRGR